MRPFLLSHALPCADAVGTLAWFSAGLHTGRATWPAPAVLAGCTQMTRDARGRHMANKR